MKEQAAIPKNSVIAAVIKRDGKYLICQRPAHKRHGTLWEFPGGKVEPGENWFQAAERELDEELGVKVTRGGSVLFSFADPASGFMINFVEVDTDGEPILIEHSALQWLPAERLQDVELAPSDLEFARYLTGAEAVTKEDQITGAFLSFLENDMLENQASITPVNPETITKAESLTARVVLSEDDFDD